MRRFSSRVFGRAILFWESLDKYLLAPSGFSTRRLFAGEGARATLHLIRGSLGQFVRSGGLVQPGLPEHFQELVLRPHVDGLRHQFPAAVIDKTLGDAFDLEQVIYFSARI